MTKRHFFPRKTIKGHLLIWATPMLIEVCCCWATTIRRKQFRCLLLSINSHGKPWLFYEFINLKIFAVALSIISPFNWQICPSIVKYLLNFWLIFFGLFVHIKSNVCVTYYLINFHFHSFLFLVTLLSNRFVHLVHEIRGQNWENTFKSRDKIFIVIFEKYYLWGFRKTIIAMPDQ